MLTEQLTNPRAGNAAAPEAESPPDRSTVTVTNIEVKFRPVSPNDVPNAEHPYIEITRADGTHQTIGAYPVGGNIAAHDGQLTFIADNEHNFPTAAEFELHAPIGMTLTHYANSLFDGAQAYNLNRVRYDYLGEEGVNSGSFVSSLLVAKGGATGLADVRHIASIIDSCPVRTAGQESGMTDAQCAELVARDLDAGRLTAPGFGHAGIAPQRFSRETTLPTQGHQPADPFQVFRNGVLPEIKHLGAQIESAFDRMRGVSHVDSLLSATPHIPGGPLHIKYAGHEREAAVGYRQSGTITSVRDGIVTQSTGRSSVEYKLSDLLADARDPEAMQKMLVPGREVRIAVGPEQVHITSLERNNDLDLAQRHAVGR